jgi:hypothetical protein
MPSFKTIAIYVAIAAVGIVLSRKVAAIGDLFTKIGL